MSAATATASVVVGAFDERDAELKREFVKFEQDAFALTAPVAGAAAATAAVDVKSKAFQDHRKNVIKRIERFLYFVREWSKKLAGIISESLAEAATSDKRRRLGSLTREETQLASEFKTPFSRLRTVADTFLKEPDNNVKSLYSRLTGLFRRAGADASPLSDNDTVNLIISYLNGEFATGAGSGEGVFTYYRYNISDLLGETCSLQQGIYDRTPLVECKNLVHDLMIKLHLSTLAEEGHCPCVRQFVGAAKTDQSLYLFYQKVHEDQQSVKLTQLIRALGGYNSARDLETELVKEIRDSELDTQPLNDAFVSDPALLRQPRSTVGGLVQVRANNVLERHEDALGTVKRIKEIVKAVNSAYLKDELLGAGAGGGGAGKLDAKQKQEVLDRYGLGWKRVLDAQYLASPAWVGFVAEILLQVFATLDVLQHHASFMFNSFSFDSVRIVRRALQPSASVAAVFRNSTWQFKGSDTWNVPEPEHGFQVLLVDFEDASALFDFENYPRTRSGGLAEGGLRTVHLANARQRLRDVVRNWRGNKSWKAKLLSRRSPDFDPTKDLATLLARIYYDTDKWPVYKHPVVTCLYDSEMLAHVIQFGSTALFDVNKLDKRMLDALSGKRTSAESSSAQDSAAERSPEDARVLELQLQEEQLRTNVLPANLSNQTAVRLPFNFFVMTPRLVLQRCFPEALFLRSTLASWRSQERMSLLSNLQWFTNPAAVWANGPQMDASRLSAPQEVMDRAVQVHQQRFPISRAVNLGLPCSNKPCFLQVPSTLEQYISVGDKRMQNFYLRDENRFQLPAEFDALTTESPSFLAGGSMGSIYLARMVDDKGVAHRVSIKRFQDVYGIESLTCKRVSPTQMECPQLTNEMIISTLVSQLYEKQVSPNFVRVYSSFAKRWGGQNRYNLAADDDPAVTKLLEASYYDSLTDEQMEELYSTFRETLVERAEELTEAALQETDGAEKQEIRKSAAVLKQAIDVLEAALSATQDKSIGAGAEEAATVAAATTETAAQTPSRIACKQVPILYKSSRSTRRIGAKQKQQTQPSVDDIVPEFVRRDNRTVEQLEQGVKELRDEVETSRLALENALVELQNLETTTADAADATDADVSNKIEEAQTRQRQESRKLEALKRRLELEEQLLEIRRIDPERLALEEAFLRLESRKREIEEQKRQLELAQEAKSDDDGRKSPKINAHFGVLSNVLNAVAAVSPSTVSKVMAPGTPTVMAASGAVTAGVLAAGVPVALGLAGVATAYIAAGDIDWGKASELVGKITSLRSSVEKRMREQGKQYNAYLVMEELHGDLRNFSDTVELLQNSWKERQPTDRGVPPASEFVRNALFQVVVVLYQFQRYFRGMHNDAHLGNFFVKLCDSSTLYGGVPLSQIKTFDYDIEGRKFSIPNMGFLIKIGDFGFANIETRLYRQPATQSGEFVTLNNNNSLSSSQRGVNKQKLKNNLHFENDQDWQTLNHNTGTLVVTKTFRDHILSTESKTVQSWTAFMSKIWNTVSGRGAANAGSSSTTGSFQRYQQRKFNRALDLAHFMTLAMKYPYFYTSPILTLYEWQEVARQTLAYGASGRTYKRLQAFGQLGLSPEAAQSTNRAFEEDEFSLFHVLKYNSTSSVLPETLETYITTPATFLHSDTLSAKETLLGAKDPSTATEVFYVYDVGGGGSSSKQRSQDSSVVDITPPFATSSTSTAATTTTSRISSNISSSSSSSSCTHCNDKDARYTTVEQRLFASSSSSQTTSSSSSSSNQCFCSAKCCLLHHKMHN